jgi:hypothetical protein
LRDFSDATQRHPVSNPSEGQHEKNQPPPDTFSVSPVSKRGSNQNSQHEERPTMDINDLFDGIMKSINQFADEIAEQRLQEKMQDTGRGPENGGKNAENFEAKEKRGMTKFPKME